jgi:hypothetical protein
MLLFIYYSSGFILVISGDTLSHDVKVIVCALCVSLRLKIGKIGSIPLKDPDFRKIPPKVSSLETYHPKLAPL